MKIKAGLHNVERLAGGDAGEDVEHDDIAQFLQADQMGERAADVAGAHQGNLLAGHCGLPHCFAAAWVACALARGKALAALWSGRAGRNIMPGRCIGAVSPSRH